MHSRRLSCRFATSTFPVSYDAVDHYPEYRARTWAPQCARVDGTLVKALARAHRWKRMLDDGRYGSVSELAVAEKLDRGYLGRIHILTLLAPEVVEAILDGRRPAGLGVDVLREGFPVEWGDQRGTMVA